MCYHYTIPSKVTALGFEPSENSTPPGLEPGEGLITELPNDRYEKEADRTSIKSVIAFHHVSALQRSFH